MAATTDKTDKADVMPELDDDVEVGTTPAATDAADDAEQPATRKADEEDKPESPRDAAVRRYREMRDAAKAPAADDDSDGDADDDRDNADDEAPVAASPAEPRARQPLAATVQPAPANDTALDATRVLLEQTKALIEEVKAARAAPVAAANDDAYEDDAAPNADKSGLDADKLEDIVERIQIGDKAEGRQALSELIEIMGGRKTDNNDVGRVVRQEMAQDRVMGEISQATSEFRTKYRGIVDDADLLESSLRRLNAEIRDDLVRSGSKAEDVHRASPDQLMAMHQQARIRGHKVRGYGEIFEKVGTDVSAKFSTMIGGAPRSASPAARSAQPQQSSTTVAGRVDRKRLASAQPRAAGLRANTEPQQKPKSRADIVMEMRRQRGFKG